MYIPTVVLGELYYGAFRSVHREKQLDQMRRFLKAAIVVGTDAQTSERYGRIRAELAQAGVPISRKRHLDRGCRPAARVAAGH